MLVLILNLSKSLLRSKLVRWTGPFEVYRDFLRHKSRQPQPLLRVQTASEQGFYLYKYFFKGASPATPRKAAWNGHMGSPHTHPSFPEFPPTLGLPEGPWCRRDCECGSRLKTQAAICVLQPI